MIRLRLAALVLVLAAVPGRAAQQDIEIRFAFPPADSYVTDEVTLEARIDPPSRRGEVTEVVFFADGVQRCRTTDVQRPRCRWDAGAVLKSHLLRVTATTSSGQRLVANTRTRGVALAEAVDVRAVQVNVAVFDRRGAFVPGLTQDRFRLREDDVPQTITLFGDVNSPLELVLAIDVSASMANVIEDLKGAVRQFLSQLRPIDHVTLVAFNDELFVLTRRETDAAARARGVNALAAWGNTALYDVIGRSLELVSRQPGRRGVVIFTDGEDSASETTLEMADRAIKASDATLFAVALGRGRQSKQLKDTLEALAESGGGRVVMADDSADLQRAFTDVLESLQQQYMLGYQSTNPAVDGTWRRLTVDVTGEGYRVRARQGYLAVKP